MVLRVLGSSLLALLVTSACATRGGPGEPSARRADAPHSMAAVAPYGATLRILVRAGGRSTSFRAGCAVDPTSGARIEARDPLGSTRLLVLVPPGGKGTLLIDPARSLMARWTEGEDPLSWVPPALWYLLSGAPPEGSRTKSEAGGVRSSWSTPGGTVRAQLTGAPQGPAPFAEGRFRGPGRAELRAVLAGVQAGAPPADAFLPPDLPLRDAEAWEILSEEAP